MAALRVAILVLTFAGAALCEHVTSLSQTRERSASTQSLYATTPIPLDLSVNTARTEGDCVGTLAARIPRGNGMCEAALLTAAHCIANAPGTVTDIGAKTKNIAFSIPMQPPGRSQMATRFENTPLPSGGDQGKSDVALIRWMLPCSQLGTLKPARLAECKDGIVPLNENALVFAQKRVQPNKSNYGGGARFPIRLTGVFGHDRNQMYAFRSARHRIEGGDSGGPLVNPSGEVVSVVARTTVTTPEDDGLEIWADQGAACFAQETLRRWKMWPAAGEEDSPRPNAAPGTALASTFATPSQGKQYTLATQGPEGPGLYLKDASGTLTEVRAQLSANGKALLTTKDRHSGAWSGLKPEEHRAVVSFYRSLIPPGATVESVFGNSSDAQLAQAILESLPEEAPAVQSRSPAYLRALQTVRNYETGKRYVSGNPRTRFNMYKNMFAKIEPGGTATLILVYFGEVRRDLEQVASRYPLIEVRNYPLGSNEHKEAQAFGAQALGIDGLGRKITRYADNPMAALQSLIRSGEEAELRAYLDARRALGNPHPEDKR